MDKAKKVTLPLGSHFKFSIKQCPKTEIEKSRMDKVPYANVVGSVTYIMIYTRLGLAFTISVLSRYICNLGECHWEAMK